MNCNCELCVARAAGVNPAEWALRNDPIALAYRRKNKIINSDGHEYLYPYRDAARLEKVLREKHAKDPQKLLFNIYRYGSEDEDE